MRRARSSRIWCRSRCAAPGYGLATALSVGNTLRLMLDEGTVAAPQDIGLCLILGAGWPFHLGGITPYLDRTGMAEKINGTPSGPSPPAANTPQRRQHNPPIRPHGSRVVAPGRVRR